MPWFTGKDFMLYVLDYMNKQLYVIDSPPVPEWRGDISYRKYEIDIAYF